MYNPNYINWGSEGWRCPICGRVYSPSTPMCFYCSNQETIQSDKTTITSFDDAGWWDNYNKRTTGDIDSIINSWKTFTIAED